MESNHAPLSYQESVLADELDAQINMLNYFRKSYYIIFPHLFVPEIGLQLFSLQ